MTKQELHYLRSILGNLREFRKIAIGRFPTIGSEVLSDNIDWLDCFIERKTRKEKGNNHVR